MGWEGALVMGLGGIMELGGVFEEEKGENRKDMNTEDTLDLL